MVKASNKTGGTWVTKSFPNWKKAVLHEEERISDWQYDWNGILWSSNFFWQAQWILNKNSPHSIFVHCHSHLLQLACV